MIIIHTDQACLDQLPEPVQADLTGSARGSSVDQDLHIEIYLDDDVWHRLQQQYPDDLDWPDHDTGGTWVEHESEDLV